jgi:YHS domain-containing protein
LFIRKLIKYFFFLTVFAFIIGAATAYYYGIIPTSIGIHSKIYTKSNIAMDGYDIVNYYLGKSAVKGNTRFSVKLDDYGWLFNSDRALKMFKAKPQKYIPQFGGYCVYTISKGYTYPPDPNVWRLYRGKLYFFKDEETKQLALDDWMRVIENAKLHWIE